MTQNIIVHESRIVDEISFEYFCVADGWKSYGYHTSDRPKRINRKVYVWKLRKNRTLQTKRKDRPLGEPQHLQGFSLLSEIRHCMKFGFASLRAASVFVALTPKMYERIMSARLISKARCVRCKNPFDMIKAGKAKVYHWDYHPSRSMILPLRVK